MSNQIFIVAKKEFSSFFTSPIAYIFLGSFVLIAYYNFFWVDKFFARNIADLRPLFNSLPLLLIFLVATMTMRMWSEEKRSGTLEFLLTSPVRICHLVLGKFLACFLLVAVALIMTISLPVTVSKLGQLDWGPVIGAYLASLLLAAAYIAIGLFISAKSENQIVSLILTILLGGIFYFIGADYFTGLFTTGTGETLKFFSSSAHFDSISRGVLDFKDIYYYLSLTGIFLTLNILAVQKLKWSEKENTGHNRIKLFSSLLILNLILGNLWLQHTRPVRLDLTAGKTHSISGATKDILTQLQEPLLIRGYFSNKTHPLLAPLVPQIKDLLQEYQSAGKFVRTEAVDPKDYPELEEEAGRRFSIRPTPLQISDRHQASLINSYFDLVVQYGDKFEVLSFKDLIEINVIGDNNIDVRLRNPEYDITRSIKKVLYGFQSIDNLFQSLKNPVTFKAYISADNKLPEQLAEFKTTIKDTVNKMAEVSGGKFKTEFIEPESGEVAKEIAEKYGFRPMLASLFDENPFYFYMLVDVDPAIQVALPQDLSIDAFKTSLEAALKRMAPGFLRTIGVVTPPEQTNPYLRQAGIGGKQFNILIDYLRKNNTVQTVDLKTGFIPEVVDLLLVLAPKDLSQKELYSIDQFLMRGGTVTLATAPFSSEQTQGNLRLASNASGLEDWLLSYGIEMESKLVFDEQNEPFPVPTTRNVGGFAIEEIQMLNYPLFVDIRQNGMNENQGMLSGITQVTLNWTSPLTIDVAKNNNRKVVELLHSSKKSWLREDSNPIPDFNRYPEFGFEAPLARDSYLLAGIVQGNFLSYFKDKEIGFLKEAKPADDVEKKEEDKQQEAFSGFVDKSPESSRLIIFSSNDFLSDSVLQMSAVGGSNRYLNSLQLVENSIDWSLEDPALLSIRGRSNFARTLLPLTEQQKSFWEYGNYLAALIMLVFVWLAYRVCSVRKIKRQLALVRV